MIMIMIIIMEDFIVKASTGELPKTNSCSVEQAISYFTVNTLSKQESLFSSMTFYQRTAESFFFFTAYAIDSCYRLINKLLII